MSERQGLLLSMWLYYYSLKVKCGSLKNHLFINTLCIYVVLPVCMSVNREYMRSCWNNYVISFAIFKICSIFLSGLLVGLLSVLVLCLWLIHTLWVHGGHCEFSLSGLGMMRVLCLTELSRYSFQSSMGVLHSWWCFSPHSCGILRDWSLLDLVGGTMRLASYFITKHNNN